ncbi:FAD/NAD(P)-binding domain-containing protein [Bimuria novae-zelandiae CBS 107.79]|uniref:FAD/NAD(P)-binding domain-containing protein n=1 Tax=Bimuria novae-zelandiae CBS 107.79 TaxID=1447943 RepID=A0A6A5W1E0_9PLEO|nr:FAD/NAD(P)-binding domain-containing protein [Bimuria novae-zelandiae CBS 107.79]
MGVVMAINAQRALKVIVGDDVDDLFARAGAVKVNSSRVMIGAGPHAGTKVLDVAEERPGKTMHHADLLRELLAPIPPENMHASKKLVRIEEATSRPLTLHFSDNTSTPADALIGADSIFGFVRSHVLPPAHPAPMPVPVGWVGTINMVPTAKAREKLGAQWFEEDRQYGWCIGTTIAPWTREGGERRKAVDRAYLEGVYEGWEEWVKAGMIELLLDQADPAAYATYEHLDAPTYVNGHVCIAGDAAHAMAPWQGSGAAMALEDAVILGGLFAKIISPDEIPRLLHVYNEARRPRTQRIAKSSRQTGRILSGIDEDVGLDPGRMREALKDWWSFIYDFDLDAHIASAVKALENRA